VPVGRCAEHFENPLHLQQRDYEVILLRRNPTGGDPIGTEEVLHGARVEITIRRTAERQDGGSQVSYQPVDVCFFLVCRSVETVPEGRTPR